MQFEMPKPGPQHDTLSRMCGEFVGEETMFPSPWSPEESQRTCTLSCRMLEGFFAVSDYEQKCGDEVTFRGHGVYSWDAGSEVFKMYWFDSMGGAGGVADGTVEGNVLTFRNTSPMGHHMYRYTFQDDGDVKFEMQMSQDGENWMPNMEGIYKKQS